MLNSRQAKTVVGPLDRVKILFQASSPQFAKYSGSWLGVLAAMRDINRQDGIRGLFRGHSATLLRIFPYAGIKFLAYEQVRAQLIQGPHQETPLRRLASGSLAGVTSVLFTYPLEVVRVRLAFETKRDSRSSLARICRQIYHEQPHRVGAPPAVPSPAGAASAAPIQTATAAASTAVAAVTPRAGIGNFYRGFSPTMVGMLPYAGVSFLTHDTVGDFLRSPALAPWTTIPPPAASAAPAYAPTSASAYTSAAASNAATPRPRLTNTAQLVAGAVAGLLSQTAAYPLEVIRRRMQVGGAVGDGHRLGMRETAAAIGRAAGWRGFYVGLSIGYAKVVPMVAVSFWAYERAKGLMGI